MRGLNISYFAKYKIIYKLRIQSRPDVYITLITLINLYIVYICYLEK